MAQNKRQTIDVTFGPFPLSFPKITKPDEKYDVYTANAVDDPNSAAMKAAKAVFADAIKTFGLDPNDCKLPLVREMRKDPEDKSKKPKKKPTGKLQLKNKSKRAPAVFDSKGREINPKGLEINGGTLARVQGFISPYTMLEKVKDADGNVEEVEVNGISMTLTGVQIIKLASGRSGGGFAAYEDDEGDGWTMSAEEADALALGVDSDDGDGEDQAQDDGGILDI